MAVSEEEVAAIAVVLKRRTGDHEATVGSRRLRAWKFQNELHHPWMEIDDKWSLSSRSDRNLYG